MGYIPIARSNNRYIRANKTLHGSFPEYYTENNGTMPGKRLGQIIYANFTYHSITSFSLLQLYVMNCIPQTKHRFVEQIEDPTRTNKYLSDLIAELHAKVQIHAKSGVKSSES